MLCCCSAAGLLLVCRCSAAAPPAACPMLRRPAATLPLRRQIAPGVAAGSSAEGTCRVRCGGLAWRRGLGGGGQRRAGGEVNGVNAAWKALLQPIYPIYPIYLVDRFPCGLVVGGSAAGGLGLGRR